MDRVWSRGRANAAGFSMLELIIVAGIIGLMAAVSLPAIGNYIRNYRINLAARNIVNELQAARAKAIMKNVNYGVVFYTSGPRTYRYFIEDDQTPQTPPATRALTRTEAEADRLQSIVQRELPPYVEFGTGCTRPDGSALAANNDVVLRYNRLGAWCDPGGTSCSNVSWTSPGTPQPAPSTANPGFLNDGSGSWICLVDTGRGLRKLITVTVGGRALAGTRYGS